MEDNNQLDDFNDEDKIVHDSNIWEYKDEGSTIIGHVVEIKDGAYGLDIVVDMGEEQKTLPSLTALATKLKDVQVGDKVKIVCLGMFKSANKKDYYDFDVWIKKPE